jgi:hypothetical protein
MAGNSLLGKRRPSCDGCSRVTGFDDQCPATFNPMKIQQKSILQFAVIALAWGALCLSASIYAQSAPEASASPDANKKEGPVSGQTGSSPTPTPTPKG